MMQYIEAKKLTQHNIVFDWALPQDLWEALCQATGDNPATHVVFCYTENNRFGRPLAVTQLGHAILEEYDKQMFTDYALGIPDLIPDKNIIYNDAE